LNFLKNVFYINCKGKIKLFYSAEEIFYGRISHFFLG
jgi:hypothetical protein